MRGRLVWVVVALLATSACAALHPPAAPVASGARLMSPSPFLQQSGPSNIQLVAPSTAVVWALVDYASLYRSTDEGHTWQQVTVPDQLGVRPLISFVDDHEGWMLEPGSPTTQCQEADAEVWHTGDAGKTWQRLPATGIASAQCKNGIWFANAEQGFIAAWDDLHAASIYRTSDGGMTWMPAPLLPNPPNYQSSTGGVGWQVAWIKSFGPDSYLAANGTPYIFESTDGGASWRWVTKTPRPNIVLVSEQRWLDLTEPGFPTESVNLGQGFHPFTTDFRSDGDAEQFVFADADVGYASGGGLLQRTLDGGVHWTRLAPPGVIAEASPTPTPSTSGCVSVASGARSATWLTYTDPIYGFAISYPSAYAFEREGASADPARLALFRAVDACYLGGNPPGEVDLAVLVQPGADNLSDFVHKHSVSKCQPGPFPGVANLRATTIGTRDAVTFDETGFCGEGPQIVHSTLTRLASGYALQLDWWATDPAIANSVQAMFEKMLMTLKG